MSVTVARAEPSVAGVGDYIELMKPRVMSLVVFTALVGLVLAPVPMHPVMAFTALLCIAIGAGAAGALNMWYDADIDARMARTAARPIPAGRLARGEALAFGLTRQRPEMRRRPQKDDQKQKQRLDRDTAGCRGPADHRRQRAGGAV
jgi:heme O synthase-like polyprenyltransferase